MSYKTILVHAEPGSGCDRRVRLAVEVANLFDASLTGLGAEAYDSAFATGYSCSDGVAIEIARERIAQDLPAAEEHFAELTAHRAGSTWISGEGYPDKMLALHGRGADLIVTSRPPQGQNATYAARVADLAMEAGVPILVAPDADLEFRGEQVVVGWKDTRESRRAVTDAMPFLMRAHGVTLVSVCGDTDEQTSQVGLQAVARRLARHGVQVGIESVLKGKLSVSEALENVATRHSADLIVTGAYGHSRLQEWMLGGVTEDLVAASSRFVLLSH